MEARARTEFVRPSSTFNVAYTITPQMQDIQVCKHLKAGDFDSAACAMVSWYLTSKAIIQQRKVVNRRSIYVRCF